MGQFGEEYFRGLRYSRSGLRWERFYRAQISSLSNHVDGRIERLCDVGYGFGDFLKQCDEMGWTTFGLDISTHAVHEAKSRTKAQLEVCDVQLGIPFEGPFDAISCFDVVEHLPDPQSAIANMHRVLRKGGCLLVTTPNPRSELWKMVARIRDEDWTHISVKNAEKWRLCLVKAGFTVVCQETCFPLLSSGSGFKRFLAAALCAFGLGSTLCFIAKKS